MYLTAPAFLFIAFPLFTAIYSLVPRSIKKQALAAFCPLVYMLANIYNPFSLIFIVLTVVAVCLGTKWIDMLRGRRRSIVAAVFVAVLVEIFVSLRVLSALGISPVGYPFGASVWLIAAVSCIIDVKRGDAPPPTAVDAVLYISYFPIMLAGPIVKYRDSLELFRAPEMTLDRLARGAECFMLGFVKIFAVTLPVLDILRSIFNNIEMGFGIFATVEFIVLINIGAYSAFSGYSDMASGVSLIWGIELPKNFARPFTSSSPFEYARSFMSTLYDYLKDYLFLPLVSRKKGKLGRALSFAACFVAASFWLRSSLWMVVFAIICSFVLGAFLLRSERGKRSRGATLAVRIFGYILTPICAAVFWCVAMMPNSMPDLSIFSTAFESFGKPGSISVLGSVSAEKYFFTLLTAIFSLIISDRARKNVLTARDTVVKILCNAILILLFVFAVFFVFPQYPQIAGAGLEIL